MKEAGTRKIGSSKTASRVICHDKLTRVMPTMTSVTTLLTRPDRIEVKAVWAPITSVFSRLTNAPVCARVKNAMGCRSTCPNTWVRRLRIRPSPMRDEYNRVTTMSSAETTANAATTEPSEMTTLRSSLSTPSSMMRPSSNGVATTRDAPRTVNTKNVMISRLKAAP